MSLKHHFLSLLEIHGDQKKCNKWRKCIKKCQKACAGNRPDNLVAQKIAWVLLEHIFGHTVDKVTGNSQYRFIENKSNLTNIMTLYDKNPHLWMRKEHQISLFLIRLSTPSPRILVRSLQTGKMKWKDQDQRVMAIRLHSVSMPVTSKAPHARITPEISPSYLYRCHGRGDRTHTFQMCPTPKWGQLSIHLRAGLPSVRICIGLRNRQTEELSLHEKAQQCTRCPREVVLPPFLQFPSCDWIKPWWQK